MCFLPFFRYIRPTACPSAARRMMLSSASRGTYETRRSKKKRARPRKVGPKPGTLIVAKLQKAVACRLRGKGSHAGRPEVTDGFFRIRGGGGG